MTLSLSVFNQRFRFDTFTASFGLIDPDQSVTLYTQQQNGFEVQGSYPWRRWSRLGLAYKLSNIKITDINPSIANLAVRQLIGFTPGGNPEDARSGILRSEIRPSLLEKHQERLFPGDFRLQFVCSGLLCRRSLWEEVST